MSNMSKALRTVALIATLGVAASPSVLPAQAGQHQHGQPAAQQSDQARMKQMPMREMKMPSMKMEETAARRKANTERITKLMAQVETGQGDERIAAMAEVIGILVDERAAMLEHCAEMHGMMGR